MAGFIRFIGIGGFVGGVLLLLQLGYDVGLQSVDGLVEQSYGNQLRLTLPDDARDSLQEIDQAYRALPIR